MDIDERIANLVSATAHGTPIEQELMRSGIIAMGVAITGSAGTSAPPLVVLDTRRRAFFKRFCDQKPNLCRQYKQDRIEAVLNEVTAWRLAFATGDPWRQMLPTAVLRKIENLGGALINEKPGRVNDPALANVMGQVMAAGFWDGLIGNQDRNMRNYRYDADSNSLGLIDHAFAFARPGDPFNASAFLAGRRLQAGATLAERELEALEALLDSGDLHGLRDCLPTDRADALEDRARRMMNTRLLPGLGAF